METDEQFVNQGVDRVLLLHTNNPAYAIASNYLKSIGLGAMDGQTWAWPGVWSTSALGNRGYQHADPSRRWRARRLHEPELQPIAYWNESKLDGKVTDGYFSMLGFARATQYPAKRGIRGR